MRVPVVGVAALAFALAACDALLGLGQFKDVSCAADCGADGGEGGGGIVAPDATSDAVAVPDAGPEADAASPFDAFPGDVVMPEGGWPTPTAHELWAHWPMPNPDAASGDDGGTLPNPMNYDAGPDGAGSAVVYDEVTKLTWFPQSMQAGTYDAAWVACGGITVQGAAAWRVPTRIELVSLVDFTRTPTIDTAVFPSVTGDEYWTSSAVGGGDGSAGYWTVDFSNGFTSYLDTAKDVLCVSGGTP